MVESASDYATTMGVVFESGDASKSQLSVELQAPVAVALQAALAATLQGGTPLLADSSTLLGVNHCIHGNPAATVLWQIEVLGDRINKRICLHVAHSSWPLAARMST